MLSKALLSAASADPSVLVGDVFSTSLYTGTGSAQTITNGIDLAGKGGMVWLKARYTSSDYGVFDTTRASDYLRTNGTNAQAAGAITSFNSNGFSLAASASPDSNSNTGTYASWTFRKQPKFFDAVTYTGDGTSGRSIAHNLGSVPGCIIIKSLNIGSWYVWHKNYTGAGLYLNDFAVYPGDTPGFNTTQSSAVIVLSTSTVLNISAAGYVAYLFAHEAGGFGPNATDNAISCGSFTTDGSGNGSYTPNFSSTQWLMLKNTSSFGDWEIYDTQRTPAWSSSDARLRPNLANAEDTVTRLSASGSTLNFTNLANNVTYAIIAVAAP